MGLGTELKQLTGIFVQFLFCNPRQSHKSALQSINNLIPSQCVTLLSLCVSTGYFPSQLHSLEKIHSDQQRVSCIYLTRFYMHAARVPELIGVLRRFINSNLNCAVLAFSKSGMSPKYNDYWTGIFHWKTRRTQLLVYKLWSGASLRQYFIWLPSPLPSYKSTK